MKHQFKTLEVCNSAHRRKPEPQLEDVGFAMPEAHPVSEVMLNVRSFSETSGPEGRVQLLEEHLRTECA